VGKVTDIEISPGNKVQVTMLITRPDVMLPLDSVLTVSTSFMGERVLEITPRGNRPAPVGHVFIGHTPLALYELMEESNQVLVEIKKAMVSVNQLVSDLSFQDDIKGTFKNLKAITQNLKTTTANLDGKLNMLAQETKGLLSDTRTEIKATGSNFRDFSARLKTIAETNQTDIRDIVANLKDTSVSLKKTLKVVEELVTKKEVSEDVLATLNNIRQTSEEVKGIAQDIHSLTSDGNMQQQLKETIANAHEASEGAKQVVDRLKHFLGVKKEGGFDGSLLELDASVEWNKAAGHFHIAQGTDPKAVYFPYQARDAEIYQ